MKLRCKQAEHPIHSPTLALSGHRPKVPVGKADLNFAAH